MSAEDRLAEKLAELKTLLPPAPAPKGVYKPLVVVGNLVYTSGHLPIRPTGELVTGRLGAELDVHGGYEAARLAAFGILTSLRKQFGTLDRIRRVIKVLGVVNSVPEFTHQAAVLNGCSELLVYIFGPEAGVGARTALAAPTLPLGVPVEIEALFELEPPPPA
ncbi:MAG: RidA family protein [Thermoguttaceae bacterium]|jgi:enamine deaminase RidA (YjgF/YER057c/UK114 family)